MLTILSDYGSMYIMSVIILLITGYLLYRLIRHPIKSFELIFKGIGLMVLGILVWCGVLYCLTVY